MYNSIKITLVGLVLVLGACDSGKDPAAAKAGDKKAPVTNPDKPSDGSGDPVVEAPALDPKVEQAVTVANKISAEPQAADAILSEAGMDRETFEKLLYEIARDPELSASYAVARDA